MSWSFVDQGKGEDVANRIRKTAYDEMGKQTHDGAKETIVGHGGILELLARKYPDRNIVVRSSGHLDEKGGSCSLAFEVVPLPNQNREPR